ncbi:MAG: hypothetical protein EPO68_18145 [Planctomycetota bacterium]|nr:MAG: hypothetical protein EPO68_18145 [Planctomycetota bacterium]
MSAMWRHEHPLAVDEAARRLKALAVEKGVATSDDADGLGGVVAKDTPFGPAKARWRSVSGAIEVELVEAPAFVPSSMIERALRDGLTRVLGVATG